jgi:hypothetical protein
MSHRAALIAILSIFSGIMASPVFAQIAEPNKTKIALQISTEDHQKIILATVTADGKPLANATVAFFVKRLFGNLGIGSDVTLDDGTAAVNFPSELPGGTAGELDVIAAITNPPQYGAVRGEATFGGAHPIELKEQEFPRALWAPQAPLALILTIVIVVAGVWGTYLYVGIQLIKIRKGGIQ